nr:nucleoside 2-deoxyribosyltransferase [Paraburkholderia strydomiana]
MPGEKVASFTAPISPRSPTRTFSWPARRTFAGAGEPDGGTASEIGFAAASGKWVWAYRDDVRALRERVAYGPTTDVCERGHLVEEFGLGVNLMLACATRIVDDGPLACLRTIADGHALGHPSSCRRSGESEIRLVQR